jgi:hypothetical protein
VGSTPHPEECGMGDNSFLVVMLLGMGIIGIKVCFSVVGFVCGLNVVFSEKSQTGLRIDGLVSKNNVPGVTAMRLKGMVVTAIKSKGGGVILASALLASEMGDANKPGSKYGLSVGL